MKTFDLSRPVLTIGRSGSNDIVLPDPSVSKHHARVVQEGDGWKLADIGSTNGSWLNGERVKERRLENGDRIRFGVYSFTFDAVGAPPGGD